MTRHLPTRAALFITMLSASAAGLRAGPPMSLDDRLTIELVAEEPQLVTPTGVACDVRDNAWVIESNTHSPPKDYQRNATDRVWVFSAPPVDAGGDAKALDAASGRGSGLVGEAASGKASATRPVAGVRQMLFADRFKQAMGLTVTPAGRVYVTCRNEIVLLEDKDHDLKPDAIPPATDGKPASDRRVLVRLETQGTYPHNGLNGAALSPDGAFLYFCLGLNAGFNYAVVGSDGSDGSRVAGGGEGGSIWRCTPDGGKVERVATGFWNCHDLTFDAFGRLFAVDNDPDDIGPCRLLDIIEGGDYGWKYKNGRKGVHPFTSWDGHLPGTLPMVAPTGEAPSGILAYESDDWPADYRGQLLVTSWGDHTIQRFELKEKGASFTSAPADVVRGGEDFRPVGIAQASDGSVWVTDWVDKSYTLHGKGKLWRICAKAGAKDAIKTKNATNNAKDATEAHDATATREPRGFAPGRRPRADDVAKLPADEQDKLLADPRREIRVAAGDAIVARGRQPAVKVLRDALDRGDDERAAAQAFWASRHLPPVEATALIDAGQFGRTNAVRAEAYRIARQRGDEQADKDADYAMGNRYVAGDFSLYVYRNVVLGIRPDTTLELPVTPQGSTQADPFVQSAMAGALARSKPFSDWLSGVDLSWDNIGILRAVAARRSELPVRFKPIPGMLRSSQEAVRRLALQWVGEDRLTQFAPNIADALKAPNVSRDLLAAYLACREKLETPPADAGKPVAERSSRQFAAEFLLDEKNDLALRKIALELIDPADPKLPSAKLVTLAKSMGLEAVKALAWRDDAGAQAALRAAAADAGKSADWRREAVVGLARSASSSPDTKRVLLELLLAGPAELRTDALRSLRGALTSADAKRVLADLDAAVAKPELGDDADRQEWAEQLLLAVKPTPAALPAADRQRLSALVKARPTDTAGWQAAAKSGGYPDAGRRLFALATGARCFVCHQTNDRGGQVGPDLSGVGRAMNRAKLVESILEPSKEVAPLYVSIVIELKNGDTISGVGLPEPGAAYVSIADASGKRIRVKAEDIASRRTEKVSVMPEGLVETLTVREFRDLVAYLASRQ